MTRAQDLQARFHTKYIPEPNSGCWLWTAALSHKGYGVLRYVGRWARAHRVSWKILRGPIPNGLHVCHKCDNRLCVNPDHLFLGTNDDNVADMIEKGRHLAGRRFGEQNATAKLTASKVAEIRRSRTIRSSRSLAREFGISHTTILRIWTGQYWPEPAGDTHAGMSTADVGERAAVPEVADTMPPIPGFLRRERAAVRP